MAKWPRTERNWRHSHPMGWVRPANSKEPEPTHLPDGKTPVQWWEPTTNRVAAMLAWCGKAKMCGCLAVGFLLLSACGPQPPKPTRYILPEMPPTTKTIPTNL